MNRILFERFEIRDGIATFSDVRAEHVRTVLHGEAGQVLKTGEIDGLIGTSTILSIREPAEAGAPPEIRVSCSHGQVSAEPWIDVILAPPRPRVMKRLLPQLATLGVGRIVLVGAEKVEKAFWGAQLLKEEIYRPLLIDGLQQAGTSILPTIQVEKGFRRWVERRLDAEFAGPRARIVAHPYGAGSVSAEGPGKDGARPVLAIGPEGGWTDEEVGLLEAHGFARMSLGGRILRTDTAVVALLARLMPRFDPIGR